MTSMFYSTLMAGQLHNRVMITDWNESLVGLHSNLSTPDVLARQTNITRWCNHFRIAVTLEVWRVREH